VDKEGSSLGRESSSPRRIRCAIYTRKSTEEGLEQQFNSLHAQREAAEAYIQSQKHLGWTLIKTHYDDGGFSGGSLDRPALHQLLEHIEAGLIDCVMVYKVDRLSRSLLDFARLMDRFEQRSVSFVSVTQQFNTTTSLGRLTLNILLSFAQFEREIISERTRDKMGAARRKGKWVGGTPLLGYDVDARGGRLVINPSEAARVREIFELYRTVGSLALVVAELRRRGWTTKSWKSRGGTRHSGRPFTKSSVRLLLTNATYAGKVRYRGVLYEGEHPAIVEGALWDAVNAQFCGRQMLPQERSRPQIAPLAGLLTCKSCQKPMIPTYADKGTRRYRYYVCQGAREKGWKSCATKSVAASLLEESVVTQLRAQLSILETRQTLQPSESNWQALLQGDAAIIPAFVEEISYDGPAGKVSIKLRRAGQAQNQSGAVTFEYAIPGRRAGRAHPSFRHQAASEALNRPPRLARLVALAHKLEELVRSDQVKDYAELARLSRVSPARIGQIVILGQLAPAIQEQVLFLSTEQAARIPERELREIAREPLWDRQCARFEQLLSTCT